MKRKLLPEDFNVDLEKMDTGFIAIMFFPVTFANIIFYLMEPAKLAAEISVHKMAWFNLLLIGVSALSYIFTYALGYYDEVFR